MHMIVLTSTISTTINKLQVKITTTRTSSYRNWSQLSHNIHNNISYAAAPDTANRSLAKQGVNERQETATDCFHYSQTDLGEVNTTACLKYVQ